MNINVIIISYKNYAAKQREPVEHWQSKYLKRQVERLIATALTIDQHSNNVVQ